jgi:hypothetical protein
MAFPSTTGSRQENLSQAWLVARDTASGIKNRSQNLYDRCAAGDTSALTILDYATYLADMKLRLDQVTSVGGIVAYAQAQIDDATFDIAAEYTAMATQIGVTLSWIDDNFPKDGSGYLLAVKFKTGDPGRTEPRLLSSAQTAGLQTALQALLATID